VTINVIVGKNVFHAGHGRKNSAPLPGDALRVERGATCCMGSYPGFVMETWKFAGDLSREGIG